MRSNGTSIESVAVTGVAEVLPGHAPRTAVGAHTPADLRILLGRDALADGRIDWGSLTHCDPVRGIERFLVRDGDVLLTTRTTSMRAVVVSAPPPNVVVSAQFAVLRPDQTRLDPRYLAWFLMRSDVLERLRRLFRGSTIPFLSITDLAEFRIALPPLERQLQLARIVELRRRETELSLRLDRFRDLLIVNAISRAATSQSTS